MQSACIGSLQAGQRSSGSSPLVICLPSEWKGMPVLQSIRSGSAAPQQLRAAHRPDFRFFTTWSAAYRQAAIGDTLPWLPPWAEGGIRFGLGGAAGRPDTLVEVKGQIMLNLPGAL